ncbi:MAG: histidine kinase [Nostoc sp.]
MAIAKLGIADWGLGKSFPMPMPNAQCPMPNAQCPMPNAQCPMPTSLLA